MCQKYLDIFSLKIVTLTMKLRKMAKGGLSSVVRYTCNALPKILIILHELTFQLFNTQLQL